VAERRKSQGPDVGLSQTKEPFAFAGLWDVWRKPDGSKVESFTIITTEPTI